MLVFKFGGASVKDAAAVKNVAEIIRSFQGEKLLIVISAMGKTTNALEEIVRLGYNNQSYKTQFDTIKQYHQNIIHDLQLSVSLHAHYQLIETHVEANRNMPYPQYYDQVVSIGELMATTIVQAYCESIGLACIWADARDFIKTDDTWREAAVNWSETSKCILEIIPKLLENKHIITQGFIGKTTDGYSTTLGREGSDYSGAIFANILQADGLYIWKDVPGVLNADPKLFENTIVIPELSYYEAIEMTYYGATVIHPKTIKPLQNKQIPLLVRSFLHPIKPGTIIQQDNSEKAYPPVIVLKKNQTLISVFTKDFSFIAEENLSFLYAVLAKHHIRVHMLQTAALSCTLCIDTNAYKEQHLEEALQKEYHIRKNENLSLLTIRHYTPEIIAEHKKGKDIKLIQQSKKTIQLLFTDGVA
jgi:aspartate kinase